MYAKDQLDNIITWDMSGKLLNHKLLDFVISACLAWVSCLSVCVCVCKVRNIKIMIILVAAEIIYQEEGTLLSTRTANPKHQTHS